MIEHVTDLLGAYVDGELHGLRRRQVEEHVSKCAACRKELAELQSLSNLLQKSVPMEAFTPVDRFVADLSLQINAREVKAGTPRRAAPAKPLGRTEFLWWLAPVGLMAIWFAVQAVFTLGSVISAADLTGLFGNSTAWLQAAPQQSLWYSASMGLFGGQIQGVSKTALEILNDLSVSGTSLAVQMFIQIVIAAAYWVLLGTWLRRRGPVQAGLQTASSRS